MRTRWEVQHDGRRVELAIEDGGWSNRVVLRVDGEAVADERATKRVTLSGGGVTVRARIAWHEQSIQRAELVTIDGSSVALEPEPGSRAARREAFARRHPGWFAAHHVAVGIGKVLVPLLGFGVLLRLLPDIPLPAIDLPSLPLPDVSLPDLPSIPLPDVQVPGWIRAIAESSKYWSPILIGLALGIGEYRRRRRQGPPRRDAA